MTRIQIDPVMKKYREYDITNDLLKEPREKIFHLENDLKNLLEFIRRIRVDNEWNMGGLTFFQITYQDILGDKNEKDSWKEKCDRYLICDNAKEENKLKDRESTIRELQLKLGDIDELSREFHSKKQECDILQKNLIEIRQALTEEVASKHDTILKLKRDCQELEERCIQADKQTAFRDDIIKELRKEIKQLKQQVSPPETPSKNNPTEFARKSSNREHVVVINHTKKIVQSGRSTVIYLQHDYDNKIEEKKGKNLSEDHTSNCSKCRKKLQNEHEIVNPVAWAVKSTNKFEDESRLHLCKSENDLIDFKKLLRPVKERSKFTNGSFGRCNTFVGSTADALKNVDFESRLKHRNISVPSNMPVKAYVNHLEECDGLRKEGSKLLEKFIVVENELELSKYIISSIASPVKNNKLSDSLPKQNLYSFMENEIIQLNSIIDINRQIMKEQLELIKIMVQKLFRVDVGLKFIEERIMSVCEINQENASAKAEKKCDCLEKTKIELNAKIYDLDQAKKSSESSVEDYKIHIQDLEKQFKEFLKDKTQLKEKYATVKNQCKCILEESVKLKSENDAVKLEAEDLKTKYEIHVQSKILLEHEISQLKGDLNNFTSFKNNCSSEIDKLTKENEKLISDLCKLNEENRKLLKNIDDQKTHKNHITTVTCDEIGKLHGTIEELHNTLEKTKRIQIEEDKDKTNKIDILNSKIMQLECSLREAEEKAKICKICRGRSRVGFADSSEVQTDASEMDSDPNAMLQERDDIILSQYETLNVFQHELQSLKDIELELRNEIEKYQKETEYLKNKINEMEKICNNDTLTDAQSLEKLMESIRNRDEIIRNQNQTLIIIQQELESFKKQKSDVPSGRENDCSNIAILEHRIEELELALKNAEGRADNLQTAVNLYMNSIKVLEASEEKYRIQIDQHRATIVNLQSALVSTKQELDCLKHKSEENFMEQQQHLSRFISIIAAAEIEKENLRRLFGDVLDEYKELQELNLNVEIEFCNSLQDIYELDNQLLRYQHDIKFTEEENRQCKNSCKKLMKQKKCYEEIIFYFKHEMSLMSEQLQNLQELLTLSNDSAQEESSKLAQAFINIQTLNEQLSTKLTAAEQKMLLENQMNQLHEVKICELERLVSEKEIDLTRHDQAIVNIRQTLQDTLKQNEDLHGTILSLNETILQLQQAVKKYEIDNCTSRESNEICQVQINTCKEKLTELKTALERKTSELCKLEMAYNNQNRTLKSVQIEMKEMKERQKNKHCHMKCIIEELKDKLAQYEGKHKGALEEVKQLQTQIGIVTRKDAVKEVEIKRYRKIIGDLKKTLIDLNKSLSRKNVHFESRCDNEECRKYMAQSEESRDQQESPPNCPCEVEFYQSIVESLKKSVIDLKKKLSETQKKNQELEEDRKSKESQLSEISKSQMECNCLKQRLMEKLMQAQAEESRYLEMADQFERELGSLRQELEVKSIQLDECKKSAQEINSCRCVQLACAQEEATTLKEDLNNLLRKHCALNVENEKLHSQSTRLQSTVTNLEETSQLLKGQVEQYLMELQIVQNEKESLLEKNRELLNELRSLQSSYHTAGKQQRYTSESVKILELELNELRNNRDEICFESKNVINYFRNWLEEQRKINQYVIAKERDFCETIEMLKQENEELRFQRQPEVQRHCARNTSCQRSATSPPPCQSPWSLGSQGTASIHEESPSRSPCLNEEYDWFSQSFRNESEEDEEDWVSKVEDLAAQVRRTNRMWKNKMGNSDYTVTRDSKK